MTRSIQIHALSSEARKKVESRSLYRGAEKKRWYSVHVQRRGAEAQQCYGVAFYAMSRVLLYKRELCQYSSELSFTSLALPMRHFSPFDMRHERGSVMERSARHAYAPRTACRVLCRHEEYI